MWSTKCILKFTVLTKDEIVNAVVNRHFNANKMFPLSVRSDSHPLFHSEPVKVTPNSSALMKFQFHLLLPVHTESPVYHIFFDLLSIRRKC